MADGDSNETPAKRLKLDDSSSDHVPNANFGSGQSGTSEKATSHIKVVEDKKSTASVSQQDDPGGERVNGEIHTGKVPVNKEDAGDEVNDTERNSQRKQEESEGDVRDEDEDEDDRLSNVSGISGMSDLSGEESWAAKPPGSISWVYRCMSDGMDPRVLLRQLMPDGSSVPDFDDMFLWKLVVSMVTEPPPRKKLEDYNTLEDAVKLLKTCSKIMVLTGAGVSVSCGIPDFRSKNGIYARLAVDFPDLPDPQAMFDISYFRREQRPFFKFAKEIYPGQFEPSKSHKFINLLETHNKLLRNYTQNIDTLEQVAGIHNVIQCHGSFATATCMECKHKCSSDEIKEDIMNQVVPMCPKCYPTLPLSVMKPDIVFFGESLPEHFHERMKEDKDQCDLLIVIGSSLKVRPVALVPTSLPPTVPQILINKERLKGHNFDIELLGDCDIVVGELCRRLGEGWEALARKSEMSIVTRSDLPTPSTTPPPSPTREAVFEVANLVKGKEQSGSGQGQFPNDSYETVKSRNGVNENTSVLDPKKASSEETGSKTDNVVCEQERSQNSKKDKSDAISFDCNDKMEVEKEKPVDFKGDSEGKAVDQSKSDEKTNNASEAKLDSDKPETAISQMNVKDSKAENSETKPQESKNDGKKSVGDTPAQGTSGEKPVKKWRPVYHCNMANLLKADQICFVPPYQYVFPLADFPMRYQIPYFGEDKDKVDRPGTSGNAIDLTSDSEKDSMFNDSDSDSDACILVDSDDDEEGDESDNEKDGADNMECVSGAEKKDVLDKIKEKDESEKGESENIKKDELEKIKGKDESEKEKDDNSEKLTEVQ
ncbi:NAD-dependent protein deacetylase sirtuin-1-like [Mya arenaria]|uniref:NAD-dependent protein deacetylase sirtuin-1-like n=1 Tax=Mya arenaria TaxID=6604 RepID=UPI0022E59FB9|nr:NAD-dependent protein deacetylase sirtuin-1-like [Mya arenaria]